MAELLKDLLFGEMMEFLLIRRFFYGVFKFNAKFDVIFYVCLVKILLFYTSYQFIIKGIKK